jgi:hypothetical protein
MQSVPPLDEEYEWYAGDKLVNANRTDNTRVSMSASDRTRKVCAEQVKRCDSYNGVEVMRLCSNPSWLVDMGLCGTKA